MSSLTRKEANFLSQLAEQGASVFTIEQAQALWTPTERTRDALHRLTQKGWLSRLERGVYLLIPLEAGPGRAWTENGWVIAQHLISPAAIAYWSALHYWNLTEQIPQEIFVQSTRRKRPAEIAGVRFHFITIIEKRFFGIVAQSAAGKTIRVTDLEKTLVDCAARPELSGGIRQLAQALRSVGEQLNWTQLDQYLIRWGGGAVVKRLGFLIEVLRLPGQAERLLRWQALVKKGISPLEPGAISHGPVRTRWQLCINVPIAGNE